MSAFILSSHAQIISRRPAVYLASQRLCSTTPNSASLFNIPSSRAFQPESSVDQKMFDSGDGSLRPTESSESFQTSDRSPQSQSAPATRSLSGSSGTLTSLDTSLSNSTTRSSGSKKPLVYTNITSESKTPPYDRPQQSWQCYLVAPVFMVILLLIGISVSLSHHFYYDWLDGQEVQSSDKQQWALR